MRYNNTSELPETIQRMLPEAARELYVKVYNHSWDTYNEETETALQDREAAAHRDGWAAVQREFVHNEERHTWYRKGEEPPELEEKQSFFDKVRGIFA